MDLDQDEFEENCRCTMIGCAAERGNVIGVAFETKDIDKVDRYIKKITERFPTVRVIDKTTSGLPSGVCIVRFGPLAKH